MLYIALLNLNYAIVDVRDVSNALIMLMEKTHLLGRYCLAHEPVALTDVLQMVHENFPDVTAIPTRRVRDFVAKSITSYDQKNGRYEYLLHNLSRIPHIQCLKAEQVSGHRSVQMY